MEAETTRLHDATRALNAEAQELRATLKEGASQVPLTEVRASVAALEQNQAEMTARLTKLRSGNVQPVSAEERDKVNAEHRKWQRTAAARKKIRNELWRVIQDLLDKDATEKLREEWEFDF